MVARARSSRTQCPPRMSRRASWGNLHPGAVGVPGAQHRALGGARHLAPAGGVGGAQAHSGRDGRQELGIGPEDLPRGNGLGLLGGRRVAHASRLGLLPRIRGPSALRGSGDGLEVVIGAGDHARDLESGVAVHRSPQRQHDLFQGA